jgi:hypothetical protein
MEGSAITFLFYVAPYDFELPMHRTFSLDESNVDLRAVLMNNSAGRQVLGHLLLRWLLHVRTKFLDFPAIWRLIEVGPTVNEELRDRESFANTRCVQGCALSAS